MKARTTLFRPSPRLGRLLNALASLLLTMTMQAETNFTVITMTNVWRYNETTNVDGTGWQQPGYDDSSWAAGPGMIGFENNADIYPHIQTRLQDPLTFTPYGHCVYFRTRFNIPVDPRNAILTLTNRIDDGAVFYLNGAQLTRVRVTASQPGFYTAASGSPPTTTADATADEIVTVTPTNLFVGENVLAVSLHNTAFSSDLVFGCAVNVLIPDPIVITNQPQSQTVESNSYATFAVGVSGSRPTFQWQFKNSNIAGATNAFHTVSATTASVAGDYRVIIANSMNRITSAVATLTLVPDATPVALVSGLWHPTNKLVLVTFSEPIQAASAGVFTNYAVTLLGTGERIEVTDIKVFTFSVVLTVASRQLVARYAVAVNGVKDVAGNLIAPDSRVGIGITADLVAVDAQWNWSEDFDLSGQNWTALDYNESTNDIRNGGQWKIPDPAWNSIGRGFFYFYGFSGPTVTPRNTVLHLGSPTFYFRSRFVAPEGFMPQATIKLISAVDDGAVFYLNGTEFYRRNMPAGMPGVSTRASSEVGSAMSWTTNSSLVVSNLVAGTNVLAVELHPFSIDPADYYGVSFSAALSATLVPNLSSVGPMLPPYHDASPVTPKPPPIAAPPFSDSTAAAPAPPGAGGVSNVIHISFDGGAAYWIESYVNTAPDVFSNLHRLQVEGAVTYNARCDATYAITVPNHISMLTGRPVEQPTNMLNTVHHGFLMNSAATFDDGSTIHKSGNTNVPYISSVFDVAHDHGLGTEFIIGKAASLAICDRSYNEKYGTPDMIPPDHGPDKIDYSVVADSYAEQLVSLFLQNLKFQPPKRYTFLHFADPDKAGHRWGWGSPEWSNSIVNLDQQLGRIMDAIQSQPSLSNHAAIIVTADHGGLGSGHWIGGGTKVFQIPLLVWGPGIPAGVDLYSLFSNRADPGTNWLDYTASPQPLRNGDTGNLALNLLGLPSIPGSMMIPKFAWDEPSLALQTANAALLVSWSGYATNFQLEASTSLDPSAIWTPVTEDITRADGRFTHAANASSGENRFYRLRRITP